MSSMNYKIIPQPTFLRELRTLLKKYRNLKNDLQKFNDFLLENPLSGVDLGGGLRKVRMPISDKNKGKSHGARVITYTYFIDNQNGIINLIFIYDKQERDSISKQEIKQILDNLNL